MFGKKKVLVKKSGGYKAFEKDAPQMAKKGYKVTSTTSFRKSFALFREDGYVVTYELVEGS
ncbi:MAG: hypothetical protein IPO15_22940, partial [Anaerolineae bacterium]|uniref:hypothetical protein n=1 Tax=Candidatus Amarolinea dominans TaxID=3140696 RepID=UPI003134EF27|nr:hypothetical protein [Anaerolineae bacterium]